MKSLASALKSKRMTGIKPTSLIVLSFLSLVLIGTLLLMLPVASRDGKSTYFIDALFTATSAVCVTGLVVVDTYQHWSTFGQLTIMLLIQTGALGIITFATFFYSLLGKKFRLKSMVLMQESVNTFSFQGVINLVKSIVIFTVCTEGLGALLLAARFVPEYGLKGFYLGIFHSITAFCNAGFDLMSISGKGEFISLTYYNNDPVVIYTIASLIVIGGLGFIVWNDLYEYKRKKYVMLHTKLVLLITSILIVSGAILFFAFESGNPETMGNLDLQGKINASIFHSVTTRTAGFNSVNTGEMRDISKMFTIILMFIGAAPGSTGGGIKVTTFGVIIVTMLSQLRGSEEVTIFKRRISYSTVSKAMTIFGFSMILVLVVTTIIMTIEGLPLIDTLYEVVSGFGTVGLTTGITSELHDVSKMLLIFMMFIGRVGPVSFAMALAIKSHRTSTDIVYPEGKVIVG